MIEKTIAEIEAKLASSEGVKGETRAELQRLLTSLKQEMAELARTHGDQARTIAGYTKNSTEQAFKGSPEITNHSLKELAESVSAFETSHPQLVQVVNRICVILSNLGI